MGGWVGGWMVRVYRERVTASYWSRWVGGWVSSKYLKGLSFAYHSSSYSQGLEGRNPHAAVCVCELLD